MKKLFWCSWYQPTDDYRPMTFPPNEQILGWWCTGSYNKGSTLCALVEAIDETDVKNAINKDWPEITIDTELRFCDETTTTVLNDRFSLSDWMIPRLEKWKS